MVFYLLYELNNQNRFEGAVPVFAATSFGNKRSTYDFGFASFSLFALSIVEWRSIANDMITLNHLYWTLRAPLT